MSAPEPHTIRASPKALPTNIDVPTVVGQDTNSGLGWITCTTNGLPAAPSRWRAHPGLRPKTRTYPLVRTPVGQGVWSAQNAVRWTNASVDLSSVLAIIGRKPPS